MKQHDSEDFSRLGDNIIAFPDDVRDKDTYDTTEQYESPWSFDLAIYDADENLIERDVKQVIRLKQIFKFLCVFMGGIALVAFGLGLLFANFLMGGLCCFIGIAVIAILTTLNADYLDQVIIDLRSKIVTNQDYDDEI